jgi:hypothetical protein
MMRPVLSGAATVLALTVFAPTAFSQTLHTNDRWHECAIVLDPSLSPAAWRQFVREVGLVTYYRPLVSAAPMGRRNFEISLLRTATRIDDADAAWNDTFSHPDSEHYLFEGSALHIPGVSVRAGVTDRVDVGVYYTQNYGANYGFLGGQVQYNLHNDTERRIAAAGRVSVVTVFGPEDVDANTVGLDFVVSKGMSVFEPYVSVSGYMAHARETTSKVDLDAETQFGAQATLGVAARVYGVTLGGEYTAAKVSGVSLKIGFGM